GSESDERLKRLDRFKLSISGLRLLTDIFARHVIDDLYFLRRSRAVAHHDHRAVAGVLEGIKRSPGDQRGLARLQSDFAAIGETYCCFGLQKGGSLIRVIGVDRVFLSRLVVSDSGMEPWRIKNVLTPFLLVRHIDEIDDFNPHCKTSSLLVSHHRT